MDGAYNCSNYRQMSDLVVAKNINYTQLFLECPDVCPAIVGNGNPDIAGIGVNQSLPNSLKKS